MVVFKLRCRQIQPALCLATKPLDPQHTFNYTPATQYQLSKVMGMTIHPLARSKSVLHVTTTTMHVSGCIGPRC